MRRTLLITLALATLATTGWAAHITTTGLRHHQAAHPGL